MVKGFSTCFGAFDSCKENTAIEAGGNSACYRLIVFMIKTC